MEIRACPKCGSKHIDAGTMGAGVTFGVTSWKSMCKDCGYQGEPLLFDSEISYNKFLDSLKNSSEEKETAPDDKEEFIDERQNKEINDIIGDLSEEKTCASGNIFEKKEWWIEIIVSIVLAGILMAFSVPGFFTIYGLLGGSLFAMLVFILIFVTILFILVILEYFAKKIIRLVK